MQVHFTSRFRAVNFQIRNEMQRQQLPLWNSKEFSFKSKDFSFKSLGPVQARSNALLFRTFAPTQQMDAPNLPINPLTFSSAVSCYFLFVSFQESARTLMGKSLLLNGQLIAVEYILIMLLVLRLFYWNCWHWFKMGAQWRCIFGPLEFLTKLPADILLSCLHFCQLDYFLC